MKIKQHITNIKSRLLSDYYNLSLKRGKRFAFLTLLLIGTIGFIYINFRYREFAFIYALIFVFLLQLWLSQWFTSVLIHHHLVSIKFCNQNGEYPSLIYTKKINNNVREYVFLNIGIPLSKWEENKSYLISSFEKTVDSISLVPDKNYISIRVFNNIHHYKKPIYWKDSFMVDGDNVVLGERLGEPYFISLRTNHHFLIGGQSGSGKTKLLLLILHQCIKKDYEVYIADFKHGVDFNEYMKKNTIMLHDKEHVLTALLFIKRDMESRMKLLADSKYSNIDEYNDNEDNKIHRIIFACDEMASLTDLKALSKDEKETTQEIIRLIKEIGEKGRACGVSLILSLQRPDADVLPGRIKNNLTYRVAGKCDRVLSEIILESTEAYKEIEKCTVGVFYDNYNNKFKAYLLKDKED